MKTIVLMRHAKSDWSSGSTSDHERPLNGRGRKSAPEAAQYLNTLAFLPDLIISSTAVRACETADLVGAELNYSGERIEKQALYSGTPVDYLDVVRAIPSRVQRVLLVAHNPLLEETAALLLAGELIPFKIIMPTAAMVCISFEHSSWSMITPGDGILRWMRIPRMNED